MADFDGSPTLALMKEYGIEATLDNWLEFNGVEDVLDPELLDVLPAELCDEYERRLRHNIEMNRRFEQMLRDRSG